MPVVDAHYWSLLSRRLLPLDRDPALAPVNLDTLQGYWGDVRQLRPAAVLVGLVERRDGIHVVLTRRHDAMTHHAGQISFPGGRIDPGDADAVHAALRETQEEIGIAAGMIVPLGRVEPIATVSEYIVQPIVARIDPDYEIRLQASEVSAAFELPLARAAQAELWQPYPVNRRGLAITMKALDFQGHTIWGATAMIIERLLVRLEGLAL